MTTISHKFVRFRERIASYAEVTVRVVPGGPFSIVWGEELACLRPIYGAAAESGIASVMRSHRDRGGDEVIFHIDELKYLAVDTKPDAVRCAATAAAWTALGHEPDEVEFLWSDGWTCNIRPSCQSNDSAYRRGRARTSLLLPYVVPVFEILNRAYPAEIPEIEYLAVLQLLSRRLQPREVTNVAWAFTSRPWQTVFSDAQGAVGLYADDSLPITSAHRRLAPRGFDEWVRSA